MESLSRNIENQKVKSVNRWNFDEENHEQNLRGIHEEDIEEKRQREPVIDGLITELFKDSGKTEKVENFDKKENVEKFIWEKCQEPIADINNIINFADLSKELILSAQKEHKDDVAKNIENWNYEDPEIYKLSRYKELLEKWFILPSDIRPYYKWAKWQPEHHLWIDYQVKEWVPVKAIYGGKVVASGPDWWLWHRVIIEHEMEDWTKFYSLYGHLWKDNLIPEWTEIKEWEFPIIWKVWPFSENWWWPSHLHFQIMENVDSPRWHASEEWIWNYDVLKAFRKK